MNPFDVMLQAGQGTERKEAEGLRMAESRNYMYLRNSNRTMSVRAEAYQS